LPVKIYSFTKKPIHPKIYAMFTLLFLLIFVLMVAMNLLQLRGDKRKTEKPVKAESRGMRIFKRVGAIACVILLLAGTVFLIANTRQNRVTLNVMNWGQNIADGSDGTMDIIAAFEEAYPYIDVNYSEYASNEELYSKLSTGGLVVDLIIPSDYMIARMIKEEMLLELDFDNIPNYKNVLDTYKNQAYDPENKFSVPYTWGTVGIIYNSKFVDEADVTGWDLLWNEKYAGQILMFDNSRDAFGVAQYMLGIDVNTTDKEELQQCADALSQQRPLVQQYVMDQVYAKMEEGNAWIAPYYAGDAMMMMENNEDLRFYLPEEQTFNLFIDAMCIPTCCENKEAAELFIDFMCNPEISGANMDYICYGSPIDGATEYMEQYLAESEVIYPPETVLERGRSYGFLPEDITRYVENLFLQVRLN
jgi:spermidine/putrescine transport system substrate-binding protein